MASVTMRMIEDRSNRISGASVRWTLKRYLAASESRLPPAQKARIAHSRGNEHPATMRGSLAQKRDGEYGEAHGNQVLKQRGRQIAAE
jgi:hypothetical protein